MISLKQLVEKQTELQRILSKYGFSYDAVYGYGYIIDDHIGAGVGLNLLIENKVFQQTLGKLSEELTQLFGEKVSVQTIETLQQQKFVLKGLAFPALDAPIDRIISNKRSLRDLINLGLAFQRKAEELKQKITQLKLPCRGDLGKDQLMYLVEQGKQYHEYFGQGLRSQNNVYSFIEDEAIKEVVDSFKKWNLHQACVENNVERVKKILDLHPDWVNDQESIFENTPLHIATHNGYSDLVALLKERNAKSDIKNKQGYTADKFDSINKNPSKFFTPEKVLSKASEDDASSSDEEDDNYVRTVLTEVSGNIPLMDKLLRGLEEKRKSLVIAEKSLVH